MCCVCPVSGTTGVVRCCVWCVCPVSCLVLVLEWEDTVCAVLRVFSCDAVVLMRGVVIVLESCKGEKQ